MIQSNKGTETMLAIDWKERQRLEPKAAAITIKRISTILSSKIDWPHGPRHALVEKRDKAL